jgi:hypothetical protein
MILSVFGQPVLRLAPQLLNNDTAKATVMAMRNNFFILYFIEDAKIVYQV